MRKPFFVVSLVLSCASFNAISAENMGRGVETAMPLDVLKVSGVPTCKSSGDGTFAEIVTTMASVLPPDQGDALLAKYCGECAKQKFNLNRVAALPTR